MIKIGIWNTAFLGDAILTLPLLHSVSQAYPEAELHFFVRKGVDSLFTAQPELTSVRGFDKRGKEKGLRGAYRLGRSLAQEGFDLWISPHTSLRSGLIARWTSASRRIGYNSPWFNNWLYTHTVDRAFDQLEEIERLGKLLEPLSIPSTTKPTLVLPPQARVRARNFFADIDAPTLGIHPGSTWPTKQWPLEYFASVMRSAADAGIHVLLFAGPDEVHLAEEVLHLSGVSPDSGQVSNLAGQLSLPELGAYIAGVDCYLSGDSGPMHLAWVQGTPLVAIFGPTVRELGFFPRGQHSTVLENPLDCRPCSLHGPRQCPKGHHDCMRGITPDAAWDAVRTTLEQTRG